MNETAVYDSASLAILDRLSTIETLLKSKERTSPSIVQGSNVSDNGLSNARVAPSLPAEELPDIVPSLEFNLPSLARVRTDTILSWPILQDALSSAKRYYFLDQDGIRTFTYLSNPTLENFNENYYAATMSPTSFSIDRVDVERLVSRFFLYTHTKNPILDKSTVNQYCCDLYENGVMWNLSTCMVLLVCALGAVAHVWEYRPIPGERDSSTSVSRQKDLEIAKSYYQSAEKRLGLALRLPGTLSVQCLCLAG